MMNQALIWAFRKLNGLNQKINDVKVFRKVPWSIVYHIQTHDGVYYLKVSHPIYSIEGKILCFFEKYHFQHVPRIVGFNQNLNAILLENAGENCYKLFHGNYYHFCLQRAIKYYAKLQIHASNYLNVLAGIIPDGCYLKNFSSSFENFLIDNEDILFNDGVNFDDLKAFKKLMTKLEKVCQMLDFFNIPNSIEHGDLFDENILLKKHSLTLSDWADAGLGHPFFSYGFFIHRLMDRYHVPYLYQSSLEKTYLKPWEKYYSYQELKDVLNAIIPLSYLRTLMSYARIAQIDQNRKMTLYKGYLSKNLLLFIHDFKRF
jgi:hypothetical protein